VTDPVVEGHDLAHRYPDGTTAVDGVDVTLRAGERVALLGPNGAGKSTVLGLLGGLLDPDGGTVRYFGDESSADAVRDRIAVLTQDPGEYLFNPTVREDIAYGPTQLGLSADEIDARVERLADRFDLRGLLDRPPFRLSGGEQRRAALASVLAVDPDVLMLDEPLSNVDGENRAELLDLLADLHADGVTLLVSTPDTDLVPRVADRVILLDRSGRIARRGPVRELLADPATLTDAGLSVPTVVDLFDRAGYDDLPVTIEEAAEKLDD
jgi:cobalt/nickel transport system ATP-binding protein